MERGTVRVGERRRGPTEEREERKEREKEGRGGTQKGGRHNTYSQKEQKWKDQASILYSHKGRSQPAKEQNIMEEL